MHAELLRAAAGGSLVAALLSGCTSTVSSWPLMITTPLGPRVFYYQQAAPRLPYPYPGRLPPAGSPWTHDALIAGTAVGGTEIARQAFSGARAGYTAAGADGTAGAGVDGAVVAGTTEGIAAGATEGAVAGAAEGAVAGATEGAVAGAAALEDAALVDLLVELGELIVLVP